MKLKLIEQSAFLNNRQKVQQAFFNQQLIMPLTNKGESIIIEETKNEGKGNDKLKLVTIENIPVSDEIRPKSYVLDLELNKPVLNKIEKTKTVEKAILLFTYDSLMVFMIEMKSSLDSVGENGLKAISRKFEHSMGRISMILTSFIFNETMFEGINIDFFGIVCYNRDAITTITDRIERKNQVLYDNLKLNKPTVDLDNFITGKTKMKVKFIQNPTPNTSEMTINFNEIFPEETYNFQAEYSELTLPDIRK